MKKIITMLLFLSLFSCGNSTPNDSDVKESARAAILNSVKNPSNVEFHHNEIIKKIDDNTFEYSETINATNSYGGLIAKNLIVKIKWIGDDPSEVENWIIIDIQSFDR